MLLGVYDIAPCKVAALESENEDFGSGDVGGEGDGILVAGFGYEVEFFGVFGSLRIAEEENQIDLVISNSCGYLLSTALSAGHICGYFQTGCVGKCQYEPIVEIFEEGKDKVTYIKMTAEKAAEVVEKHLKGGNVIEEYTIGNN